VATTPKSKIRKPLTYEAWKKVMDRTCCFEKEKALKSMLKYARVYKQCTDIHLHTFEDSTKLKAVKCMLKFARTFKECDDVNYYSSKFSMRVKAVSCMLKFASTFGQFGRVYYRAGELKRSPLQQYALKGMHNNAKNFKEWKTVYHKSAKASQMQLDAVMGMIKTAKTYRQWERAGFLTGSWSYLRKKAVENMDRLAVTKTHCAITISFARVSKLKVKLKCRKRFDWEQ
jgi:hypothetical protein